jgi:DNA adenine methylase
MEQIIMNSIDSYIRKISLRYNIPINELEKIWNYENLDIQKPFLKWLGGKSQIITDIIRHIPSLIENYHEPFLGGGSVLLAVLSLQKQGKINIKNNIFAYDINNDLINLYKNIQKFPDDFHTCLSIYFTEYDDSENKEKYYYSIRDRYNKHTSSNIERSAMFLFLNKTCFRGVYREGPNGFNVPYGHYKKTPEMISLEEMDCTKYLLLT